MPSYKLTYFNGRGRAEASRLVFAVAGRDFEDIRVNSDEWKELKPKSKFGMLPILDVDGKEYTQSRAIMLYLGREFGLYPSGKEQAFKVDEVIFIMEDYFSQAIKAFFAKEEEKEEKKKEYNEVQIPKFNGFLEKILADNNGGKGYFVGDKISVADIAVFDFVSSNADGYAKFPLLKDFISRISSLPNVKAWMDKRPQTTF